MPKQISYWIIISWATVGAFLAAGLLFYIRRCDDRKKLHIASAALFLAALIYILFALYAFHPLWIIVEVTGLLLFLLFIWMGYRYSFWFLSMGWLLHIVWDVGFHPAEAAPYVPQWYAWLCAGFDVVVALSVAVILLREPVEKT